MNMEILAVKSPPFSYKLILILILHINVILKRRAGDTMLMAILSASRLMKMADKAPVAQFSLFLQMMYLRHDLKPAYSVLGLL